jgi:heat shock protein HtpX
VRLLIISIIFVGIFAFIAESALVPCDTEVSEGAVVKRRGRRRHFIALALAAVGYLIASLFRFAISRNREYMADAGAATLTKKH